jgi:hypothetical protein
MARIACFILLLTSLGTSVGCSEALQAESIPRTSGREQRFEQLLAKYPNLTFAQLTAQTPQPDYLKKLSFDPATVKFYDEVVQRLQLTEREQQMLREQGVVSVDHDQRYTFGSMYFAIYSNDLPVLVTTDSILHAMHRSYDDMLMEMERTFFTSTLYHVLSDCHEELAALAPRFGRTVENYRDVDLYLTVARNLLWGAGAPAGGRMHPGKDVWDGSLQFKSKLDQDEQVLEILNLIQSLELQTNLRDDDFTEIYGGKRPIDYSQFQPRGHYTKSVPLARYFRAVMWLGRADTGWNILPPDPQSGIVSDTPRELRNAVLLTQLLESTGAIDRLQQMNHILDFLVGESDELTVYQTRDLLRLEKITDVGDLVSASRLDAFQRALLHGDWGAQRIRSQVVLSNIHDLHQVPPPSAFQMFGQRFAIDSFVLSKVVYDSIIFDQVKVTRHMPTGLDIMFALGNDSVVPLLENEMNEFPYAANLKASRDFVGQFQPAFWRSNLYNTWLDALRTLNAERESRQNVPQAMQTQAWQRKQLQTQLASWSELRHNTVLYAKQSYTGMERCEYPAGYVEPYPETYARVKFFAEEAARRIESANFALPNSDYATIQRRQIDFFRQMAETLARLEALARKELAAQPFTAEDEQWLKKVIDIRGGGSGMPTYTGWYCQLFYGGAHRSAEWEPTVVDVHTDPNSKSVLEEATGNCNFLVVAIDNEDERMIYVGPAYSYYEFRHPAEQRLTDQTWAQMLLNQQGPQRPSWTDDFQAPKLQRHAGTRPSNGR